MSNYNHYPDMDHDGDHNLKDSGMFHDMNDGKSSSGNNIHYHYRPRWWEAVIMIACLSYVGAVLKGTIPLNGFTAVLGVIAIIVFLYFLNETMVPW